MASNRSPSGAENEGQTSGVVHRGYADVSGLHIYYEVQGSGSPVILLHGGMLTIDLNFGSLIPTLAGRHQTIGAELWGHGRTADSGRPITAAALAGDVVALLDHEQRPSGIAEKSRAAESPAASSLHSF